MPFCVLANTFLTAGHSLSARETEYLIIPLKEASQERFLDLSDFLSDVPEDLVFEDKEKGIVWDHEARFTRSSDGALDMKGRCTPLVPCVIAYVSCDLVAMVLILMSSL